MSWSLQASPQTLPTLIKHASLSSALCNCERWECWDPLIEACKDFISTLQAFVRRLTHLTSISSMKHPLILVARVMETERCQVKEARDKQFFGLQIKCCDGQKMVKEYMHCTVKSMPSMHFKIVQHITTLPGSFAPCACLALSCIDCLSLESLQSQGKLRMHAGKCKLLQAVSACKLSFGP